MSVGAKKRKVELLNGPFDGKVLLVVGAPVIHVPILIGCPDCEDDAMDNAVYVLLNDGQYEFVGYADEPDCLGGCF